MKRIILVALVLIIISSFQIVSAEQEPGYWLSLDNLEVSKDTVETDETFWVWPTISCGHATKVDFVYSIVTDENVTFKVAGPEKIAAMGASYFTSKKHKFKFIAEMIYYENGERKSIVRTKTKEIKVNKAKLVSTFNSPHD